MAQPPAYNREKDFAKDFGNETDHTALNAELDRASNSINDIRANLALIQADDGKIRASSITTDSLAQEVLDYVQATALAGANAVADAATAIAREAQQQAENAVQTATGAVDKSDEAVTTAHAAQEQAQQADAKAEQALGETAQIDGKVSAAVDDALHDAVIPGLTAETLEGALGYVPYDGKTNTLDFATTAEVAGAIAARPEPVNADWNASKGAAAILNKPSTIAGYGIVDAYTKTQVDTKIAEKDCLPTQTGQTGKYLSTDGETPYWEKVDTGAMEVVEVETSGETTTLDIAPGKAYFLTRDGEYAFEGSVLEINSLPEKNNLRESSIWFDTQGQSVTIQINVEHKIVDAIPETEPYSHYVISIMGNTLIMQEMEKKPV